MRIITDLGDLEGKEGAESGYSIDLVRRGKPGSIGESFLEVL